MNYLERLENIKREKNKIDIENAKAEALRKTYEQQLKALEEECKERNLNPNDLPSIFALKEQELKKCLEDGERKIMEIKEKEDEYERKS